MKKEREMYASVMKWREGRASAIKGMVMPMVKRMGNVQGLWNKGVQGRDSATEKDVFWGTVWGGRWCEVCGGANGGGGGDIYTVRLRRGYR